MSRRKTADTPEGDILDESCMGQSDAPSQPPPTLDERNPNQSSHHSQNFKHISASGNARLVNGNIIYGDVVHHHLGVHANSNSAADLPSEVGAKLARETQEELGRRESVKEEQRQLLEEAMESLLFHNMDFRYGTTKAAQTGTCGWILDTPAFMKWSQREPHDKRHGCLWIKSKPAAGKSTIMKFAIKQAETKALHRAEMLALKRIQQQRVGDDGSDGIDINIHFFFNARGNELERTAEGLYRSLLHQLVTQHKDKRLRHWLTAHNKSTQTGWQWPLEVLQTTFEDGVLGIGDDRLTCYIDALDECDEAQTRDIVAFFERLLEEAAAEGVNFRVCFTSRHYPYLSMKNALEIDLNDEGGHAQDIERYIRAGLKIETTDAELIRADLQRRAAGVFLWVVLVVKILNRESDRGRSFALRQRLIEMPDDLHDLFNGILDPSSGYNEETSLILQWIMFASRPLRCQELYYAVRTGLESSAVFPPQDGCPSHETMAKFILHTSRGLAELTHGPNPVVQFVHESVRDFLLREDGPTNAQILDPIGRCHEQLKACCQTYLSAALTKENDVNLASHELPFLRYAVYGVLQHANAAHRSGVKQDDFVASFCPNAWVSTARLANPGQFCDVSADTLCIFAEAELDQLLQLVVARDERFTAVPGRYIGSLGTVVQQQKPTEIELLLDDDHPEKHLQDERLKCLMKISLNARFNLVMVLLLQHRWSGHIEDELCLQFLTWALSNDHQEVVNLVINHIAQLEGYAYSLLELATEDGATTVVEMLLAKNTNASFQERRYGRLLRTAVYLGHYRIVKLLLDQGADVHFSSARHGNLLWIAAKAGHSYIVQLLCTRGAVVNRRGLEGVSTPLQAACFHRHVETVGTLLECGADVRASGVEYGTALEAAMYWPHSDRAKTIVQMLRSHGAVV